MFDWIVSQIGAREHYSIPLGFQRLGCLRRFYTDAWLPSEAKVLSRVPGPGTRLAGRRCEDIPNASVRAFTWRTITRELVNSTRPNSGKYWQYVSEGKAFAQLVRNDLAKQKLKKDVAFFGFHTGCLETLEFMNEGGHLCVVDQMDTGRTHYEVVKDEAENWPGWQASPTPLPEVYFRRIESEWELASVILVNSEWSRSALIGQGIPGQKIAVAPLAYEPTCVTPSKGKPFQDSPLRVLWLGNVTLAKGIPYLIQAARLLEDENIDFRVVGKISIQVGAIESFPANVTFDGPIPRAQTDDAYADADVFVLPTLSDGFAITQIEAMSHGLPVIATPNCGEVVTDGQDGFIVPPRDADALATAILRLHRDPDLLADLSRNAAYKATSFTVEKVARTRIEAISECLRDQARSGDLDSDVNLLPSDADDLS